MQLSNRGAVESDPLARQRPVDLDAERGSDLDAERDRLHPASELAKKKFRAASSAAPLARAKVTKEVSAAQSQCCGEGGVVEGDPLARSGRSTWSTSMVRSIGSAPPATR
jgi:hypothetical protein